MGGKTGNMSPSRGASALAIQAKLNAQANKYITDNQACADKFLRYLDPASYRQLFGSENVQAEDVLKQYQSLVATDRNNNLSEGQRAFRDIILATERRQLGFYLGDPKALEKLALSVVASLASLSLLGLPLCVPSNAVVTVLVVCLFVSMISFALSKVAISQYSADCVSLSSASRINQVDRIIAELDESFRSVQRILKMECAQNEPLKRDLNKLKEQLRGRITSAVKHLQACAQSRLIGSFFNGDARCALTAVLDKQSNQGVCKETCTA